MAKTPGKTVNVKLAVVGIYFGTVPLSPVGPSGLSATKFRDAPSTAVDPLGSVWDVVKGISGKAASGGIAGCSQFGIDLTTAGRIKTVFATYSQQPRPDRMAGTYALTDSSYVGDEIINPKLAWQYYIYDKDFRQTEADGVSQRFIKSKPLIRPFQDDDIVIFRCVLIASNPVEFVPAPNLPKRIS